MYAYDGKICRNSLCLCKTRQLKKNRNDPHPRRRCGADDFDSSCIFFPFGKENEGVVPVEPGTSNSPPDCCIEVGSRPRSLLIKRAPQRGALFIGADDRTRTCTLARWNLNPMSLPIPPHPQILYHNTILTGGCQRRRWDRNSEGLTMVVGYDIFIDKKGRRDLCMQRL